MTTTQIIINYLREAYSNEKLLALLEHTESGKLAFFSCCCFEGIPSALHPLRGQNISEHTAHWNRPKFNSKVSDAFNRLSKQDREDLADAERRAALLPLIKAEIKRRKLEGK